MKMRKQNKVSIRKKHLVKHAIYIAVSAALLSAWPMTACAEEHSEEELGDIIFGNEVFPEDEDYIFASDDFNDNMDMLLEDEGILEDVFVIREDMEDVAVAEASDGNENGTDDLLQGDDFDDEEEGKLSESYFGECGIEEGTVFWELDDEGILHIFGKGAMQDWHAGEDVPWFKCAIKVTGVEVEEGVTSIGSYAFSSCRLKTARIG